MAMPNPRVAVGTVSIFLTIMLGTMIGPVSACSYSKLSLDYCGAAPPPARPPAPPLYRPQFDKPAPSPLPNWHPTIVAPRDSRGKPAYGPGVTGKF
jgi:hypothetical protein